MMTELNTIKNEADELVGASGVACLLACGSICVLTYAAGGMYYASVATIL